MGPSIYPVWTLYGTLYMAVWPCMALPSSGPRYTQSSAVFRGFQLFSSGLPWFSAVFQWFSAVFHGFQLFSDGFQLFSDGLQLFFMLFGVFHAFWLLPGS